MIEPAGRHRANYILEQGTWRATCQVCGHYVTDPLRRRAASLFRAHIRDASQDIDLRSADIDLRSPANQGEAAHMWSRPGLSNR